MNWTRAEGAAEHLGERLDGQRLGEAGHALEQHVAAGEQRDEQRARASRPGRRRRACTPTAPPARARRASSGASRSASGSVGRRGEIEGIWSGVHDRDARSAVSCPHNRGEPDARRSRPPLLRAVEASAAPPCASATARTIESPRPVPRRARARRSRSNGCAEPRHDRRGAATRRRSPRVSSTSSPSLAHAMRAAPPARPWRTAFSTRLPTRRSSSAGVAAHAAAAELERDVDARRGGLAGAWRPRAARPPRGRPGRRAGRRSVADREHQQPVEQRLRAVRAARPRARATSRSSSALASRGRRARPRPRCG